MNLIQNNNGKRPTGLIPEEQLKISSLLQTKVREYNKASSILAEVIRAAITEQQFLFPKLYPQDGPSIYDAHSLFYDHKFEMVKGKEKLLKNTKKSMDDLEMEVKNGTPFLCEYVVALNKLAFKFRQLNDTVQDSVLLDLLQTKGNTSKASNPTQPHTLCHHGTTG